MPTYRANPEGTVAGKAGIWGIDTSEEAESNGGIPVRIDSTTRVVAKGSQGGAQKTMNSGSTLRNNNGVVMPSSDKTGLDPYPGKSGGTKI